MLASGGGTSVVRSNIHFARARFRKRTCHTLSFLTSSTRGGFGRASAGMSGIEIEREELTVSALAFLGVKGEKRLLVPTRLACSLAQPAHASSSNVHSLARIPQLSPPPSFQLLLVFPFSPPLTPASPPPWTATRTPTRQALRRRRSLLPTSAPGRR